MQGDKLGSRPGWQNWRGSISGMLSAELLTGQRGLLCKCEGNNNKNGFCQNRKIIRTISILQKIYLAEVNCISRELKACTNCTQNSTSKQSRDTPTMGVQKEPLLFLLPTSQNTPSYLTLHPLSASLRRGGPLLCQLLISPGSDSTFPHRKTLSILMAQGGTATGSQEVSGTATLMRFSLIP